MVKQWYTEFKHLHLILVTDQGIHWRNCLLTADFFTLKAQHANMVSKHETVLAAFSFSFSFYSSQGSPLMDVPTGATKPPYGPLWTSCMIARNDTWLFGLTQHMVLYWIIACFLFWQLAANSSSENESTMQVTLKAVHSISMSWQTGLIPVTQVSYDFKSLAIQLKFIAVHVNLLMQACRHSYNRTLC